MRIIVPEREAFQPKCQPGYLCPYVNKHSALNFTIVVLPNYEFSNGHTFFVQQYHLQEHLMPYSVHMTYQYGDHEEYPWGKRQRLRESQLWEDAPHYYTEGKFLVVDPMGSMLPRVGARRHSLPPSLSVDGLRAYINALSGRPAP